MSPLDLPLCVCLLGPPGGTRAFPPPLLQLGIGLSALLGGWGLSDLPFFLGPSSDFRCR